MKPLNVLLVGDICEDIYQYGDVTRINPEAPVPVLDLTKMRTVEGMVGNVNKNLTNLGAKVTQITGDNKSIKTRFIDERSGHQLLRVDEDKLSNPINIKDIPNTNYDCVVISDYNKGSLTYDNIKKIINKYKDIPIFIDTKKTDIERFDQIFPQTKVFIKINLPESKKLTTWHRNLIVTDGKNGASFKGTNYPTPEVSVADPCGAGDTFLAALAHSYTQNQTLGIEYAIQYANYAASITVKHLGVYAPTLEEIENALIGQS